MSWATTNSFVSPFSKYIFFTFQNNKQIPPSFPINLTFFQRYANYCPHELIHSGDIFYFSSNYFFLLLLFKQFIIRTVSISTLSWKFRRCQCYSVPYNTLYYLLNNTWDQISQKYGDLLLIQTFCKTAYFVSRKG